MGLDIGHGMIRANGDIYFKDVAGGTCQEREDFVSLLKRLREEYGNINITISEGFMNDQFRYTVWEMPWEEGEI